MYQQSLVQLARRNDWSITDTHEEEWSRESTPVVSRDLSGISALQTAIISQSFVSEHTRYFDNTRSGSSTAMDFSVTSAHVIKWSEPIIPPRVHYAYIRPGYVIISTCAVFLLISLSAQLHRGLDYIHGVMDQIIIGWGQSSLHVHTHIHGLIHKRTYIRSIQSGGFYDKYTLL